MIKTNKSWNVDDVPITWIFEHFCGLTEKLKGQDVKINSVFNTERTPSMSIYIDTQGKYKFKDFSSGYGGNAINLVMYLKNLSYHAAVSLILKTYNNKSEKYEISLLNGVNFVKDKYSVTSYELRQWNMLDADYWGEYQIGSALLEMHNVRPLKSFTMSNNDDTIIFSDNHIYGYFRSDGELYKIYQPFKLRQKFIKVKDFLQGSEQLVYDKKNLVICSGLKDLMSFKLLKFNTEVVAPDSENSMIKPAIMLLFKNKYENIYTLFDNDRAGKLSMEKYTALYITKPIKITLDKDVADCVKNHGLIKSKEHISSLTQFL